MCSSLILDINNVFIFCQEDNRTFIFFQTRYISFFLFVRFVLGIERTKLHFIFLMIELNTYQEGYSFYLNFIIFFLLYFFHLSILLTCCVPFFLGKSFPSQLFDLKAEYIFFTNLILRSPKRLLDKLHVLVVYVIIKTFVYKQQLVYSNHHILLMHAFNYHGDILPLYNLQMER